MVIFHSYVKLPEGTVSGYEPTTAVLSNSWVYRFIQSTGYHRIVHWWHQKNPAVNGIDDVTAAGASFWRSLKFLFFDTKKKMGYGLRNATANLPAYSNIISDIHNTGMGMQPAKNDAELRKKPPVGHRWQNPKANHPWSLMEYSVLMGTIFEYSLSELDCWD